MKRQKHIGKKSDFGPLLSLIYLQILILTVLKPGLQVLFSFLTKHQHIKTKLLPSVSFLPRQCSTVGRTLWMTVLKYKKKKRKHHYGGSIFESETLCLTERKQQQFKDASACRKHHGKHVCSRTNVQLPIVQLHREDKKGGFLTQWLSC